MQVARRGSAMKIASTGTAVAAALLLGACSQSPGSPEQGPELPPSAAEAAPTTTTPTIGAKTNERGLIEKKLGQKASLGNEPGASDSTFTIDKVTVDPPCAEFGQKPDSGHVLVLDVRVATGPDREIAEGLSAVLYEGAFSEVGKDGVTTQAEFSTCAAAQGNELPAPFGINQKYRGQIELVVPEANGKLIQSSPALSYGGWEWTY